MKTTYQDLFTFVREGQMFLRQKDLKETKLTYAVRKAVKRGEKVYARGYEEPLEDLKVQLCEVDENDVIVRDEHNMLKFKRENLQKLNAKQRELVEAQVDFEPHIVPVNGTTLTMPQIEAFAGFVIEDKEPQE
jgi:hypothetical protein